MHSAVKAASIAVGALAFITTLSGCSDSTAAVSPATTASATTDIDREASLGLRSTRVCVLDSRAGEIGVQWSQYDTASGNGVIAGGAQLCAEGSHSSFTPYRDVEGSASVEGTNKIIFFQAHNAFGASPSFGVDCVSEGNWVDDHFDIGQERTYNDCGMSITVTRQADDDWINFLIDVK
jgi:hypothetical protein